MTKNETSGETVMSAAALIAWRERLHLSQAAAAESLGCGRRSIQHWESGVNEIPKYIALACAAVALGITPPADWQSMERA